MMAECEYCGAPILWIRTDGDRYTPCDVGEIPFKRGGDKALITGCGETVYCEYAGDKERPDGVGCAIHWNTRPVADQELGR